MATECDGRRTKIKKKVNGLLLRDVKLYDLKSRDVFQACDLVVVVRVRPCDADWVKWPAVYAVCIAN